MAGRGVLIVDDLVDTGKTARVVRELIRGSFRDRVSKPMGRPLVDTFITEVVAGHLDLLSLGYRSCLHAADP